MISVTTENVPGRTVTSVGGIVHTREMIAPSMAKAFKEVGKMFAGATRSIEERYAEDVDTAYSMAFENIYSQASDLGCDAIVGVRMELSALQSHLFVEVYGTAVKLNQTL